MALGARPDGPPLPVVADRRPSSPDRRLERQRSGGSGSGKEVSDAPPPPSSEDGVPTVEETPLLGATRADRHDAAAALLRAGADPTLGDARGAKETPLLCCARRGSAEIARALLRALAGRAAAAADDARLKLLCHVDRRFGLHPETALEAAAWRATRPSSSRSARCRVQGRKRSSARVSGRRDPQKSVGQDGDASGL